MIFLLTCFAFVVQLIPINVYAETPVPKDWTNWVESRRKELNEEYSTDTAKDLERWPPKTTIFIVPDGAGSYKFADKTSSADMASLKWDGKQAIVVTGGRRPIPRAQAKIKGWHPRFAFNQICKRCRRSGLQA